MGRYVGICSLLYIAPFTIYHTRTKKTNQSNMANATHDIQETQDWIKRVIDSCEYQFHFNCVQSIIDNFQRNIAEDKKQVNELRSYFNEKRRSMKII